MSLFVPTLLSVSVTVHLPSSLFVFKDFIFFTGVSDSSVFGQSDAMPCVL